MLKFEKAFIDRVAAEIKRIEEQAEKDKAEAEAKIKAESEESTSMVSPYNKGSKAAVIPDLPAADEIAPPPTSAPPATSSPPEHGPTPRTTGPTSGDPRRRPPPPS